MSEAGAMLDDVSNHFPISPVSVGRGEELTLLGEGLARADAGEPQAIEVCPQLVQRSAESDDLAPQCGRVVAISKLRALHRS